MPDSTYNYFQQAVKLEPGNPSILNNLGVVYGQEKNYDSAKSYFRRAIYVKPDYKPASNNLIKIFKELNQLDSITNFLKGTSLFDPNSPSFMNDMGMAFFDQKRYDSARLYMRKAIQKDPGYATYTAVRSIRESKRARSTGRNVAHSAFTRPSLFGSVIKTFSWRPRSSGYV